MTGLLTLERHGGIATLWLNRPDQFNALSDALIAELTAALVELAADRTLRVAVLGGRGRAFSAGHDLKEMRARPDHAYYHDLFTRCSALMLAIRSLPVPLIARVHGLATAAGCQIVAAADLAIAGHSAKFAVSGINVGLFCSTPAVPLTRAIAPKRAFEMLVTGRFIDAATAEAWGLINRAVADDELDGAIDEMARIISEKSPAAIRRGKALVLAQQTAPVEEAYAIAARAMADNMMEPDAGEGIDAFIAKRKPVWTD